MAGLVPATHGSAFRICRRGYPYDSDLSLSRSATAQWVAGTSPAMTWGVTFRRPTRCYPTGMADAAMAKAQNHAGMTGSSRREGCAGSWNTAFSATRQAVLAPSGSPVLGFTSKRGKLLEEMSTRTRCPFWKTSAVG